ncbi:MAG: RdgB/HAM1 family non-canonical purine NTP pyrophosphatase [Kiritimatiellae bacterium]|nr:RdgB/HAM1 family non-canonical purine NTP pyrophosphatase [Kiritimatiellia bacterium]
MKLLIASRNPHKLAEIRAIFNLPGMEIVGAHEIGGLPEVLEDGRTFQANAVKKAVSLAMLTKLWTLADDSGLEVDALNGEPGVYSARFAGEPANHTANNVKLLSLLEQQENRAARFICVVALSSPGGRAQIVEGICPGRIIRETCGEQGFGYDPIFVPDRHEQTFAQMDAALKNQISHRARALKLALQTWGELLGQASADWPARRPKLRDTREA